MATITDIVNEVAVLADVVGVSWDAAGPITENFAKIRVRYVLQKSAEVREDGDFFIIATGNPDNVTDDSEAFHYKSKPDILDPPTPQRDPFWDEAKIITEYEAATVGQTVVQVNISVQGDTDIVNLRVDSGTEIISVSFLVWMDGTTVKFKKLT